MVLCLVSTYENATPTAGTCGGGIHPSVGSRTPGILVVAGDTSANPRKASKVLVTVARVGRDPNPREPGRYAMAHLIPVVGRPAISYGSSDW